MASVLSRRRPNFHSTGPSDKRTMSCRDRVIRAGNLGRNGEKACLAKAAIDYVQIEQNHCGLMFKDAASPGKLANAKRDRWRAFTSATN
jgi:hypothetical protein